jgi:hypothetical protein
VVIGLQAGVSRVDTRPWVLREFEVIGSDAHVVERGMADALRMLAGAAGMAGRSSRPYSSQARTPVRTEHRIVALRVSKRLGPARIARRLGLPASTVHAVLRRYGCPPLAHVDRGSGARVRRYERERPGELVHAGIKKLGSIPDSRGWRTVG